MLPFYYQTPYPLYHQVVTLDPSPSFKWCPRKLPINWQLIEQVDVDTIQKNMDINSLEYLVQNLAFGNLTKDDYDRFQSPEILKGFMLLQLGVEYLTHLKRPIPTQPDSIDLRKALSEAQRRNEELEMLLAESEAQKSRFEQEAKIYKRRFETVRNEFSKRAEEDGEIISDQFVDPFLEVRKELNKTKTLVEARRQKMPKQSLKQMRFEGTDFDVDGIFKTIKPNSTKKFGQTTYRPSEFTHQYSLPT